MCLSWTSHKIVANSGKSNAFFFHMAITAAQPLHVHAPLGWGYIQTFCSKIFQFQLLICMLWIGSRLMSADTEASICLFASPCSCLFSHLGCSIGWPVLAACFLKPPNVCALVHFNSMGQCALLKPPPTYFSIQRLLKGRHPSCQMPDFWCRFSVCYNNDIFLWLLV